MWPAPRLRRLPVSFAPGGACPAPTGSAWQLPCPWVDPTPSPEVTARHPSGTTWDGDYQFAGQATTSTHLSGCAWCSSWKWSTQHRRFYRISSACVHEYQGVTNRPGSIDSSQGSSALDAHHRKWDDTDKKTNIYEQHHTFISIAHLVKQNCQHKYGVLQKVACFSLHSASC